MQKVVAALPKTAVAGFAPGDAYAQRRARPRARRPRRAVAASAPTGSRCCEKAVTTADGFPYAEPPDWYYPPRQTLGAWLLRAKKPAEAQKVFEEDLKKNPDNGWSLTGLTEALHAQKKSTAAVEAKLPTPWKAPPTSRSPSATSRDRAGPTRSRRRPSSPATPQKLSFLIAGGGARSRCAVARRSRRCARSARRGLSSSVTRSATPLRPSRRRRLGRPAPTGPPDRRRFVGSGLACCIIVDRRRHQHVIAQRPRSLGVDLAPQQARVQPRHRAARLRARALEQLAHRLVVVALRLVVVRHHHLDELALALGVAGRARSGTSTATASAARGTRRASSPPSR